MEVVSNSISLILPINYRGAICGVMFGWLTNHQTTNFEPQESKCRCSLFVFLKLVIIIMGLVAEIKVLRGAYRNHDH